LERITEFLLLTGLLVTILPFLIRFSGGYAYQAASIHLPELYGEYAGVLRSQTLSMLGDMSYESIASFESRFYGKPEDLASMAGIPLSGLGNLSSVRFAVALRPLSAPAMYRGVVVYLLEMPDMPPVRDFESGVSTFMAALPQSSRASVELKIISDYSTWKELVENPPDWAVVVNPYSAVPIPKGYAGSPSSFVQKIGDNCKSHGWMYVNTAGYPMDSYHIEGGGTGTFSPRGSGLNSFLQGTGASYAGFSTVTAAPTSSASRAYGLAGASAPGSVAAYAVSFSGSPNVYVNYYSPSGQYRTLFLMLLGQAGGREPGFLLNAATSLPDRDRGFLAAALAVYSALWYTGDVRIFTYGGVGVTDDPYAVLVWMYKGGKIVWNGTAWNGAPLSPYIRLYNPDLVVMVSVSPGLPLAGYYVSYAEPSDLIQVPSLRAAPRLVPSPKQLPKNVNVYVHTYAGAFALNSTSLVSNLDATLSLAGATVIVNPADYSYSLVPLVFVSYPPSDSPDVFGELDPEDFGMATAYHYRGVVSVRGTSFLLEVICGK